MIALGLGRRGLARAIKRIREQGFAAQVLGGADVAAMIAEEPSVKVLGQAREYARHHDEPFWQEACARRLLELEPTPEAKVNLASILAAAGKLVDVEALLAEIPDRYRIEAGFREALGVLHAKRGRIDDAVTLLEALPGRQEGVYPAYIVLPTAEEMLHQCDLAHTSAFVGRLRELYPEHLVIRSLYARCLLYEGNYDRADVLAQVPAHILALAPEYERRLMRETRAAVLSTRGWNNELFEFARDVIREDRTHWSMYSTAAEAATATWRSSDFDELVMEIPSGFDTVAGAIATRCRWQVDRGRIDQAEELLGSLRRKSASLFLSLQIYLSVNNRSEDGVIRAYQDCLKCGAAPLGPMLAFCLYSYYYNNSDEKIIKSVNLMEEYKDIASCNVVFWQTYLKFLVAADNLEKAKAVYFALPNGLQRAYRLRPFRMYFEAGKGDDVAAKRGWTSFIRDSRHYCVNARTPYPDTVCLRYVERPGDVLLFSNVFNGTVYLDWFIDHYRALGVDHFFFIDNGSTDGTAERLLREPDVSLFSNLGSFAGSAFGIVWTNHQLQRFGIGHWCFHVDIDEGFVFPGQEQGRTLRDLLAYMDGRGFESMVALELDMYPERLGDPVAKDPFVQNCYFDTDYFTTRSELPPYVMIQGGIRQRLTGLALSMHKVPLLRVTAESRYIECNHNTTHLPVADVTAALLHYKFVGDMAKRLDEAIDRGEHFGGAISYRRLNAAASEHGWGKSLLTDFSRRFEGPASIEAVGHMHTSAAWNAYRPGSRPSSQQ